METLYDETEPNTVPAAPPIDRRFVPVAELGRGGMGSVYRCHDVQMDRDVAVKIRHDRLASTDDRARFLREAHMQGRLQHPSIVPVYEIRRGADGRDLFVMREIDGKTLRAVLAAKRSGAVMFGGHALLTAFSRVCMAIDYCHRHGVLHRDLKPNNVMLGEYGEVYVLDWGVAIERDQPQRPAGTKRYAAPEQHRGEATEASDVYSLGMILTDILDADADGAAPELRALAARATDEDPARRPQSARALAATIDRHLEGERDLAMRRRLADMAASDACVNAARPGAGARRTALREAGRALALDPDHPDARSVLHQMLTEEPAELPAPVVTAVLRDRDNAVRSATTVGAAGFAAILALAPLELAMGVRDPIWFAVRIALLAIGIVTCFGSGRWWQASRMALAAVIAMMCAVIVTSSLVLGPFVSIPSAAILTACSLALLAGRRHVGLTSVIAATLLGIPLACEGLGWIPRSFDIHDGAMTLHARMLDLPPTLTLVYVMVKELILIVVAGVMLGRFRDHLSVTQTKLQLHAWQLEQLLPESRDDTIVVPPPITAR